MICTVIPAIQTATTSRAEGLRNGLPHTALIISILSVVQAIAAFTVLHFARAPF